MNNSSRSRIENQRSKVKQLNVSSKVGVCTIPNESATLSRESEFKDTQEKRAKRELVLGTRG